MSKCKNGECELKEDKSIIEQKIKGEKRFSFTKYGICVYAKNLQEAEEKIKALIYYNKK